MRRTARSHPPITQDGTVRRRRVDGERARAVGAAVCEHCKNDMFTVGTSVASSAPAACLLNSRRAARRRSDGATSHLANKAISSLLLLPAVGTLHRQQREGCCKSRQRHARAHHGTWTCSQAALRQPMLGRTAGGVARRTSLVPASADSSASTADSSASAKADEREATEERELSTNDEEGAPSAPVVIAQSTIEGELLARKVVREVMRCVRPRRTATVVRGRWWDIHWHRGGDLHTRFLTESFTPSFCYVPSL